MYNNPKSYRKPAKSPNTNDAQPIEIQQKQLIEKELNHYNLTANHERQKQLIQNNKKYINLKNIG